MPLDTQPEGIYYSKDLFKQAGITSTPTTMDELEDAVAKLKKIDVAPIAVGAKDAWPAAHWYYNFALRECSQDTLNKAAESLKFDDACWTKAGDDLAAFLKVAPFQKGFLTTSSQQGAGSSAGMLANHKAAMELMGNWNPGVIAGLTPNQKPLPDLGWFPFPAVAGGQGDPTRHHGRRRRILAVQERAEGGLRLPRVPGDQGPAGGLRQGLLHDPGEQGRPGGRHRPLQRLGTAGLQQGRLLHRCSLTPMYGQNVGNAMNTAVVNLLAGKGSAADIVKDTNAAAAKG